MNSTARDAILTAVSYADIFDYPLTEEELQTWLPFRFSLKRPRLARQGEALKQFCVGNITYYSLRSVKHLVALRNKRQQWSADKWTRARAIATLLRCIPTISLVGVTGGLTRSNARKDDDIDFFIITAPKTLWVTRALATILLDILHLRRRPTDTNVNNLVCLNMFMSEDGISVPKKERDLFTAHEVLLMTPVWEWGDMYRKFLQANRWVEKFLPKAWQEKKMNYESRIMNYEKRKSRYFYVISFILHTSYFILRLIEPAAQFIQLRYMNSRRTTEVISDNVIRFHPRDARVWIRSALGRRLAHFNIPLDKIFYGR
ncbi:hypothetical protein HY032_00920 [Candidatus Gottesmanbacteria bacterium]|nr:hypothetical protein [Candidatus Gottesmanbacteria bacterium]